MHPNGEDGLLFQGSGWGVTTIEVKRNTPEGVGVVRRGKLGIIEIELEGDISIGEIWGWKYGIEYKKLDAVSYEIRSTGYDGKMGTADDYITRWKAVGSGRERHYEKF